MKTAQVDIHIGLIDRTPIGWLRERDIDLLVCAELHADGILVRMLANLMGVPDASFTGAWVSYVEENGESDLVLELQGIDGAVVALVENKITAAFQLDQVARYRTRADRWRQHPDVASVVTVLLAPKSYLGNAAGAEFDLQITYEEIASTLTRSDDARSVFLAQALSDGMEVARRGYVMEPDEQVSTVWRAIWQAASKVAPSLMMREPPLRPKNSDFVYFPDAIGFSSGDKASIVYKAADGNADLQFSSTTLESLVRKSTGIIRSGMTVEKASKSASIRIKVPKVDFSAPPDVQNDAIAEGLRACESLREFFLDHKVRLLS